MSSPRHTVGVKYQGNGLLRLYMDFLDNSDLPELAFENELDPTSIFLSQIKARVKYFEKIQGVPEILANGKS